MKPEGHPKPGISNSVEDASPCSRLLAVRRGRMRPLASKAARCSLPLGSCGYGKRLAPRAPQEEWYSRSLGIPATAFTSSRDWFTARRLHFNGNPAKEMPQFAASS
jgi:hypothetical protein